MNDKLHRYRLLASHVSQQIHTYTPKTHMRKFHIHSFAIIRFEPQNSDSRESLMTWLWLLGYYHWGGAKSFTFLIIRRKYVFTILTLKTPN